MYEIKPRTKKIAKQLGVMFFPADNPKYKIDIYDHKGLFMFRIGDSRYSDYPTYLEEYGKEIANERRRLYMIRHAKEIKKDGSRGWWAWRALWN